MPNSLQYAAVTSRNKEYRQQDQGEWEGLLPYAKDSEGRAWQMRGDIKGAIVSVFIVLLYLCRLRIYL